MEQIKNYERMLDEETARREEALRLRNEKAMRHQGAFLEQVLSRRKKNEQDAE